MTALGHTSSGPENGFESGSAAARNLLHSSKVPERQLRRAKSHTVHRKNRKTITNSIPRSLSAATKPITERGSMKSLLPVSLLRPDRNPAQKKRVSAALGLEPCRIARPYAQARLETLLVKEAEQRAGDDIHPRLDQQILDGDTPFGPYETFRRILVEFILTVPPPPPHVNGRSDLRDQLSTSPDTRFAAAYLMTRFWFLCGVGSHTLEWKGIADYGWQLAIACIALCVRVQRDFLPPLRPVTNKELILLAPRGLDMTVYDLEQAQRDILEAVSYSLQGNTPQPFLEEIHCSLSTFQRLVAKNPAEALCKRFWARMFDALLQRNILFAPISMLAASALVALSPAEIVTAVREEICSELKMTKHEFEQVFAWFEAVEHKFVWIGDRAPQDFLF